MMVLFLLNSQKLTSKRQISKKNDGISLTNSENILLMIKGPCHRRKFSMKSLQIPFTARHHYTMARKFIKRLMPDHHKIRQNKSLKLFGPLLDNPNLWHLNRRSAKGAFAVGLMFAFWPVPFQMLLAAACAIAFRVNLPLSVALVWLTNPFTMPPIFYGAYKVGELILGPTGHEFAFEVSWEWIAASLSTIGPTFLFGCFVCGAFFATVGYFGIDWLWRRSVNHSWNQRNK